MRTYNTMTDEQLIADLRLGEKEIMDYLMVKYKSMVRRKAKEMFLIGGENDDLIQEGMMVSALEASKRKKHLPLNSYVSLYETGEDGSENRDVPLIDTIRPEVDNNPEALYFGKEYTEVFIENLKVSLSSLENHVLYLHLMGTDYRTIAEILNKSPKTVDNALQRIKAKAGKLLNGK